MRYKYIGAIGAFLIAIVCLLSGLMYYFNQGTHMSSGNVPLSQHHYLSTTEKLVRSAKPMSLRRRRTELLSDVWHPFYNV
ncbi:hypothetical protein E2986_13042 [Frieseomelitta varia]|uniref:Uncharacterized protein n=1 Tax=Frieseomelitta varia TaxID=561572 RepID=A0A833RHB0_9HYME|nr:hypothetical protein E2986_13042 [Frieseomelitta varia]